jgi:TorA maturation chaperone TorD
MQHTLSNTPKDDHARAECYGLIANLFYGRADPRFLKHLTAGNKGKVEEPGAWQLEALDHDPKPSSYMIAFRALQSTCSALGEDDIRLEYEMLFLGGGAGSVSPFTSAYTAQAQDRHLRALRDYLVACGLARADSAMRIRDHVSAVCDVMRWLIERKRPLDEQLAFFNEFVRTSLGAFCDALEARKAASFYRAVAVLARAFIEQEVLNLEHGREHAYTGGDLVNGKFNSHYIHT